MAFTGMSGTDVEVRIGGDSSGAERALSGVRDALFSTRKAALAVGGVLAGALAAKGLGAAVSAASRFEDAMVEVEKVTNPETARNMADAIREMSQTMPIAQEELAGLVADAARFGVRGEESLQRFADTAAKMATATDLSSTRAGEALAKLSELTGTPIEQIGNLGSAINTLSNNFATSSSEIVDSMLRSSAALSQFGLDQTEIAGFSAALNAVSESSERAGTRLRRVAQELMDPRKVGEIAEALGMNVDELRALRQEDPAAIIQRMAEAFAAGGDEADALRNTLSTASRQAIAGLAQNLDGLRTALETSTESFAEGTSLQEEFDAATDTFSARLQTFNNNLNEVAITVGNRLLPPLNRLLEAVNGFTSGGGLGEAFTVFVAVVNRTVMPTVRRLLEVFRRNLPAIEREVRETIQAIRAFWAEWGDEIMAVAEFVWGIIEGVIVTALDNVLTSLRIVLNLIQGDWGEAWEGVKRILMNTVTGIVNFLRGEGRQLFRVAVRALTDVVTGLFDRLRRSVIGDGSGGIIGNMIGFISDFIAADGTERVRLAFFALGRAVRLVFEGLKAAVIGADGIIRTLISDIADYISSGEAKSDIKTAFTILSDVVTAVFNALKDAVIGPDGIVRRLIRSIVNYLRRGAKRDIRQAAREVTETVEAAWSGLMEGLIGNSVVIDMNDAIVADFERMRREVDRELGAFSTTVNGQFGPVAAGGGRGRGITVNVGRIVASSPEAGREAGRALKNELRSHDF